MSKKNKDGLKHQILEYYAVNELKVAGSYFVTGNIGHQMSHKLKGIFLY